MDSLKKLLSLELIGWILIALASFSVIGFGLKAGILLILLSKICKSLELDCKLCKNKCKK